MPSEPERPIEKLLRGCAGKRREQAGPPLELHPATRRRLQGEVRRRFHRPDQAGFGFIQFLGRFRLRLLEGLALIALLAVVASVLLPPLTRPGSSFQVATNDKRTERIPKPPRAAPELPRATASGGSALAGATPRVQSPPGAGPGPGAVASAQFKPGADSEPAAKAQLEAIAPAEPPRPTDKSKAIAPPGPAPATAPLLAGQAYVSPTRADRASRAAAESQEAGPAPAESPGTSLAARAPAGSVGSLMAARTNLFDPASPSVLVSFQVEQRDHELRVIDRDGSIYTGSFQVADAFSPATAAAETRSFGVQASESPARRMEAASGTAGGGQAAFADSSPALRSFRVSGTNRTLNQAVLFTGKLMGPTNVTRFYRLPSLKLGSEAKFGLPQAQPRALSAPGARIVGEAVVGHGKEFPIDAAPAKPEK